MTVGCPMRRNHTPITREVAMMTASARSEWNSVLILCPAAAGRRLCPAGAVKFAPRERMPTKTTMAAATMPP
jgi:hypothetical protein